MISENYKVVETNSDLEKILNDYGIDYFKEENWLRIRSNDRLSITVYKPRKFIVNGSEIKSYLVTLELANKHNVYVVIELDANKTIDLYANSYINFKNHVLLEKDFGIMLSEYIVYSPCYLSLSIVNNVFRIWIS